MIRSVEALNFRALRDIRQPLGAFHVLVGPNASGKTTFLDVVMFLRDLVRSGLEAPVAQRTRNPSDLVWWHRDDEFQLAIEAAIPKSVQTSAGNGWDTIRYEIGVRVAPVLELSAERVLVFKTGAPEPSISTDGAQGRLFPSDRSPRETLLTRGHRSGVRTIVNKVPGGNANFYTEVGSESGKGWQISYKLAPQRSALGNLPEDETKFPAATWLKRLLANDVQSFVLNSLLIRLASPPSQEPGFKLDGSNLPWVVAGIEKKAPDRVRDWVSHLATALPELEGIRTVEREDDKHRYLVLRYRGGLDVPSWMASDGTLRLMALTLPAYLLDFKGIYLIEEPENGIHPRAVETAFQSLSSTYGAQMLIATHSQVILSLVRREDVLCFAKAESGATDIVSGSEHPALARWRGETGLGVLFAAGVLG